MFVNNFEREFERQLKSCLSHLKVQSKGFRLVYWMSKKMVVARCYDVSRVLASALRRCLSKILSANLSGD